MSAVEFAVAVVPSVDGGREYEVDEFGDKMGAIRMLRLAAVLVIDPLGADHTIEDRLPSDIGLGLDGWFNPWVGWVRRLIFEVTDDVVSEGLGDPVPGVVLVE